MTALTVRTDYHPDVLRRFNSDIALGEMTTLHDEGLYRHLRFRQPGTSIGWFSIITSPGQLTIFGDMGTYVFAREQDMLRDFFKGGSVNAGYWGEKLQATDRHCGYRKYDEDHFRQFIVQDFWERRDQYEPAVAKEIWADIRDSLFDDWADRSTAAGCHELMGRFRSHDFTYSEPWEHNFEDYSFQYLWCCHAILWAARQYRAANTATTEAVPAGAASSIQEDA